MTQYSSPAANTSVILACESITQETVQHESYLLQGIGPCQLAPMPSAETRQLLSGKSSNARHILLHAPDTPETSHSTGVLGLHGKQTFLTPHWDA